MEPDVSQPSTHAVVRINRCTGIGTHIAWNIARITNSLNVLPNEELHQCINAIILRILRIMYDLHVCNISPFAELMIQKGSDAAFT
jgi:hypothetical protein